MYLDEVGCFQVYETEHLRISYERNQIKEPYIHQFKVVYIHRQRKGDLVASRNLGIEREDLA